jgi:hypothetical protein
MASSTCQLMSDRMQLGRQQASGSGQRYGLMLPLTCPSDSQPCPSGPTRACRSSADTLRAMSAAAFILEEGMRPVS